jgi:hypothetical protein
MYRAHLVAITSLGTLNRIPPLTALRPAVSFRSSCWTVIS